MKAEQQAARKVPWARIDDQSVMAIPNQNRLTLLNQTATKIWQGLISGKNESELNYLLVKKYSIDSEQAEKDVASIINLWRKAGLFQNNVSVNKLKRWHKDELLVSTPLSVMSPLYSINYQLNSYTFVIDYFHAEAFESVHSVLIHLKIDSTNVDQNLKPQHYFQISRESKFHFSESKKPTQILNTLDELVEIVQWTLIERAYRNNDWLTILHASALGRDNGKAIVFVAERGSGKSTLTRYLQKQGLIYLSDDVVPLNYANKLSPMPMAQRFKQGSWKILNLDSESCHKTYARLEGQFVKYLPPLTGSTRDWSNQWPLDAIVYPKYNCNQNHHAIKKLDNIESIHLLCQSGSVFGGAIDQAQLEAIVNMVSTVPSYSISYSSFSSELADQITTLTD